MTTVQSAGARGDLRVRFWATATYLAVPLVLLTTWTVSSIYGVLDGVPLVDVGLTPLQGFVVGVYITGPFAAMLFCWGEWNVARGHASTSWPTAPGIVQESRVVESYLYRRGACYRLEVKYSYKAQGDEYMSERLQFGNTWLDDEDFVRRLAQKYPAGAQIAVHYDPKHPSSAVLDTSDEVIAELESDFRGRAYFLAAVPVMFFVGIWLNDYFRGGS